MLVLPTAKVLLYIALQLGPAHPGLIYATSASESYVWEPTATGGFVLTAKGFPASDLTRDAEQTQTFTSSEPAEAVPVSLRVISNYSWKHDNAYVFDNGDRVEKHGDHAFYIINAGGANEKVFTILFPATCCEKP